MDYTTAFNSIDLLIIITCIFSMLIGFFRGFFREILGLCAYAAAALLAKKDPGFSRNILDQWIENPALLKVVNQFSVFFILLLIFLALSHALANLLRKCVSDHADHVTGMIFGLLRGVIVIALCYTGSLFFVPPSKQPHVISSSKSHAWMDAASKMIIPLLPDSIKRPPVFQQSLREMELSPHDHDPKSQDATSQFRIHST